MTIAVDLGRKATKPTKKNVVSNNVVLSLGTPNDVRLEAQESQNIQATTCSTCANFCQGVHARLSENSTDNVFFFFFFFLFFSPQLI